MYKSGKSLFWIRLAYWLGIIADGIWAVGLFIPDVFRVLTGNHSFYPEWDVRSVMSIAGILMTAWTVLLFWGVKSPIERRFVILLTAFIVLGVFLVALISVLKGNTHEIWILLKTTVLFVSMISSFVLATRISKANKPI